MVAHAICDRVVNGVAHDRCRLIAGHDGPCQQIPDNGFACLHCGDTLHIMRELYSLGIKHARELVEAEQKGYERGLNDGRIYLTRQPLPPEIVSDIEQDLRSGKAEREVARRRGVSHARVRGVARSMKRRASS